MILQAFNDTTEFVPDFEYGGVNNRDLPPSEQVRVKIQYPTYKEYQKLQRLKIESGSRDFTFDSDNVFVLENYCLEVINLKYKLPDGKEATIRTGADIVKSRNKVVRMIGTLVSSEILNPTLDGEVLIDQNEDIKKN